MEALTWPNVNDYIPSESYVIWEWSDDVGRWGGYRPVVTTDLDAPGLFSCEECGEICESPHGSYTVEESGKLLESGKLTEIEIEEGTLRPTTEKRVICDGCVETESISYAGLGGTRKVYDSETTLQLDRQGVPPGKIARQLGRVQQAVLLAMADLAPLYPFREWGEEHVWVSRVDVTRQVAGEYYDGPRRSCSSAVSRAVHSLIDRGLLAGAYRTWHLWYGESPPMYASKDGEGQMGNEPGPQGTNPEEYTGEDERPTLERLRFRQDGKPIAAVVRHGYDAE